MKAGDPTATVRAAASMNVTEWPNHSNASEPSDLRYYCEALIDKRNRQPFEIQETSLYVRGPASCIINPEMKLISSYGYWIDVEGHCTALGGNSIGFLTA